MSDSHVLAYAFTTFVVGIACLGAALILARSRQVEKPADLITVRELVEAGALRTVIDRRFPLEQAADAHRYVEREGRRGHVVITLHRG